MALAHIEAAERPQATGRYIVARPEMLSFLEISRIIRPWHRRGYLLPRGRVPDWAVRLIGARFGLSQDYIRKHLGIRFTVDNQRSVREPRSELPAGRADPHRPLRQLGQPALGRPEEGLP